MAITASMVKDLREATGLGMMACKKALSEADGDMDKAIEMLRKQGAATVAKRAGKSAKEGLISIVHSDDKAVMYEVNSETDFVARNSDFLQFAEKLGPVLLKHAPADINAALQITDEQFDGETIETQLTQLTGKIGELIGFKRFSIIDASQDDQHLYSYIHGTKIGVIVNLKSEKGGSVLEELGKDLAMQIAASSPLAIDQSGLDEQVIAKEKEIFASQAKNSGRPEHIIEKIVDGKLQKFYKEVTLLHQAFIKDPDITVQQRIEAAAKELGNDVSVVAFERFELGSDDSE